MLLVKQLIFVIGCWASKTLIPSDIDDIRPLMLPWVVLFAGTLVLHRPISHSTARFLRRECLRLAVHTAAVATLYRYAQPHAWACSTFAALHVAHPFLLTPAFASAFYPGPRNCTDTTLLIALIWPEIIDRVIVNLLHLVTSM